MLLKYNSKLKFISRELRKNMTDAEKMLWSKIRGKQIKGMQFYRQKTIGNFIIDFYCPAIREIKGVRYLLILNKNHLNAKLKGSGTFYLSLAPSPIRVVELKC